MDFRRASLNIFLALVLLAFILAFIVAVPVAALHMAIAFHIVSQNGYIGAAAIGFLSGIFVALVLSPFIWWFLGNYL